MKIRGVWFSYGLVNVDPHNWLPRISNLESNLNRWKCCSLSLVGEVLVINLHRASKFWSIAKVLLTLESVISRFKKLIFSFLWGSKIETVSRKSLSVSIHRGGPGLIDFVCKSKAPKVSALVNTIDNPDTKDFLLMKNFILLYVSLHETSTILHLKRTTVLLYSFCLIYNMFFLKSRNRNRKYCIFTVKEKSLNQLNCNELIN